MFDVDGGNPRHRDLISAARQQFEDAVEKGLPVGASAHAEPTACGPAVRGHPLLPGYEIVREVSRGGQGVVYRATQRSTGRAVAVKVMRSGPFGGDQDRLRFEREAIVLAQLAHPGIVGIIDRGEAAGHIFLVMDFIDGWPLHRYARDARLDARHRLELFIAVCEAVSAAHLGGVIHRDLKPGNILVDSAGRPHVLDFGVAKMMTTPVAGGESTAHTMTGEFVGSLPWASPEQTEGRSSIDMRTDVYSLGVILYQLTTDTFPYPVSGPVRDILENIQRVEPVAPSRVVGTLVADRDLDAVVLKCLEKDREQRYQTAGELVRDLRRYLGGEVVEARWQSTSYVLRKWIARNKAKAAAIAAPILIALLGIAAVVVVQVDGQRKETQLKLIAQQQTKRALSLSAIKRFQELRVQADLVLWPRRSYQVEGLEKWLVRARREVAQLAGYQAYLDEVRLEPKSDEQTWLEEKLGELITEARAFENGLISGIEERLAMAESMFRKTVEDHADAWSEVRDTIANDDRFGGLELKPQEGLVPLDMDRRTGLWEFWVYETGSRPDQDEKRGTWRITGTSGMVLVLLPGGSFAMGAQREDAAKPNFDPYTLPNESPVHQVTLAPFLLSKYEMTQGQWLRLTGLNPSYFQHVGDPDALACPVEGVSHRDCEKALRRVGLLLPTEAQWEYGARAGTSTPWCTGARKESLSSTENIGDLSLRQGFRDVRAWEDWRDGYEDLAPVASLAANAFGLHHTAGNVQEWCLDWLGPYSLAVRPGTGERIVVNGAQYHVYRGGTFNDIANNARSAVRFGLMPEHSNYIIGVRPGRALDHP